MPRGGGNPNPRPERYWTDYLRIALPIVGLILMLSVFIFWVGSIIDGNDDNADVTPTGQVALEQTPAPSDGAAAVTATVAPAQSGAPSNAEGTNASPSGEASDAGNTEPTTEPSAEESTAPEDQSTEEPSPDEQATEPPADGAEFAVDDQVVVNDDNVNIRDAAGTEGASVGTVSTGDILTIVSGPETAGDFDWYEVSTEDGTDGWIASQFLDPSDG